MAFSNVPITAGSGTGIGVDTISSINYQRVKLMSGAEGATDGIPGDSANGLDVDVTRIADGANVALGATADADTANTLIGRVKQVISRLWASLGQKAMAASVPVVIASDQSAVPVTGPTLTKGAQGATGFSTQDLKDAGRTHVNYYVSGAAAGATGIETLITLWKSGGTAASSSGSSFAITAGKKFRITSITFGTRGHATATAQTTTFALRINTAGAIATSSPHRLHARCATPASSSAWDRVTVPIPDGFEIDGDGTLQLGVTAIATYVTNAPTWDVLLTGYEY